jgi:glycosyltransferase involved in cell wall biosynthesis
VRDLLITTHTPALGSGRAMRTYAIARALAEHRDLDLLYVRFDRPRPDAAFASIPGVALHEVVPSRRARRLAAYTCARLSGVPPDFARGISRELAVESARMATTPERGRIVADGPIAAAALRGLAQRRPVIYNAHNVESGFRGELTSKGAGGLRGLRSFERGLLARASESWMVSAADMRAGHALCPHARLRLAPNAIDVAAIEPVSAPSPAPRAIFVANFAYEPNRNALRFLLDDVMARVWRLLPDARLTLVGGGLERPPSSDRRVEALGFVDDLAGAYASCACAVVPLLQGGGSPLKLIEALAYGLPTVASPRAIAGLEVSDGEHLLVADGGEAFAGALVAVLRDGAPQLGRAGRRLVRERYSIEALARLLIPEEATLTNRVEPADSSSPA